jgi:transcriptional antiterminator NusG
MEEEVQKEEISTTSIETKKEETQKEEITAPSPEKKVEDDEIEPFIPDIKIYAVKTIIGRENVVLEAMSGKAKVAGLFVKAMVHPEELRGYVFVEGDLKDIETIIKEIPHARGVLRKPVKISEIKRFMEPKKIEIKVKENDIVEVIGGPFKGEKGKVIRFDDVKGEVTIELIEVTVPIRVTVNAGLIKLIEKGK